VVMDDEADQAPNAAMPADGQHPVFECTNEECRKVRPHTPIQTLSTKHTYRDRETESERGTAIGLLISHRVVMACPPLPGHTALTTHLIVTHWRGCHEGLTTRSRAGGASVKRTPTSAATTLSRPTRSSGSMPCTSLPPAPCRRRAYAAALHAHTFASHFARCCRARARARASASH
jgi:hypothetical protein